MIDCYTKEEFKKKYKTLSETCLSRKNGAWFLSHIECFKKVSMEAHMLATTRTSCESGDPPEDYTQDCNKSINSIIKKQRFW